MVPLNEFDFVKMGDTLLDTIRVMAKTQNRLISYGLCSTTLFVLDIEENCVGSITQCDILKALNPVNGELAGPPNIHHTGLHAHFLQSMLRNYFCLKLPVEDFLRRNLEICVETFMHVPEQGECVAEGATISEAIHRMIRGRYEILFVMQDKKVVGIVTLNDLAVNIFYRSLKKNNK